MRNTQEVDEYLRLIRGRSISVSQELSKKYYTATTRELSPKELERICFSQLLLGIWGNMKWEFLPNNKVCRYRATLHYNNGTENYTIRGKNLDNIMKRFRDYLIRRIEYRT